MSRTVPVKLVPRNVAALRRGQSAASAVATVAGNPASTRLESGVGNCFPGLECDLRNLERRFFPFLEVNIATNAITVIGVNRAGVDAALAAGQIDATGAESYGRIDTDVSQGRTWRVVTLRGAFGPLGVRTVTIATVGQAAGEPPDAWTAIRLLTESTEVQLTLQRGSARRSLTGNRERYLDDNGALAAMFVPGELTQSLCSPWTHDFRDCGCFYWASNHPDIAQPPRPDPGVTDPEWNRNVPWERADRDPDVIPAAAVADTEPDILDYYEINQRWQELNFVLEGREALGSYVAAAPSAQPFAAGVALEAQLRYAAGVELAVMQTYLTSAYSLRATGASAALTDDINAARAELMRIAFGEMRHLRAVNDVLAAIARAAGRPFTPALRVARILPGETTPWQGRAATPEAITNYIRLEAPSISSVDGLYARILATLERDGEDKEVQNVRSIIAEGEDHYETFQFIQEWLGRHPPATYLRNPALAPPPANNVQHQALQQQFTAVLTRLYDGYSKGLPAGAVDINQARTMMVVPPNGLASAAQAVANAGFLVVFDALADPRFAPTDPPPA